jgi:hypothetical protein
LSEQTIRMEPMDPPWLQPVATRGKGFGLLRHFEADQLRPLVHKGSILAARVILTREGDGQNELAWSVG